MEATDYEGYHTNVNQGILKLSQSLDWSYSSRETDTWPPKAPTIHLRKSSTPGL